MIFPINTNTDEPTRELKKKKFGQVYCNFEAQYDWVSLNCSSRLPGFLSIFTSNFSHLCAWKTPHFIHYFRIPLSYWRLLHFISFRAMPFIYHFFGLNSPFQLWAVVMMTNTIYALISIRLAKMGLMTIRFGYCGWYCVCVGVRVFIDRIDR